MLRQEERKGKGGQKGGGGGCGCVVREIEGESVNEIDTESFCYRRDDGAVGV